MNQELINKLSLETPMSGPAIEAMLDSAERLKPPPAVSMAELEAKLADLRWGAFALLVVAMAAFGVLCSVVW